MLWACIVGSVDAMMLSRKMLGGVGCAVTKTIPYSSRDVAAKSIIINFNILDYTSRVVKNNFSASLNQVIVDIGPATCMAVV